MKTAQSRFLQLTGLGLSLGAGLLGAGIAQVPRSGGGGTDAHAMQQLQELGAARTALLAENTQLKKDLEGAKEKLGAASKQAALGTRGSAACQQALQASQATVHSDAETIDQGKQKLQELVAKFRETVAAMKGVETERSQCQQQLTSSQGQFQQCAQRNLEMYKVTDEVLKRLDHESAFGVMARSEPFTRIQRTRIENLVDDYRAKAGEQRVQPPAALPAADILPASK